MPSGGGLKTRLMGPVLGVVTAALVLILSLTPYYANVESTTLDLRFKSRSGLPLSPRLVHVDIDDRSIERWGRWPWPYTRHAQLIRLLKELGAKDVFFDVDFPSPSNPSDDAALAEAMRESGDVYVAYWLQLYREPSAAERRIEEALRGEFDAAPAELARRLKLPPAEVDARIVGLKRRVAEQAGFDILARTGALSDNALLDRLMPRHDEFVPLFEARSLVPAAVDHCLAQREVDARGSRRAPAGAAGAFPRAEEPRPPIALFARAAAGFGVSNTPPDPDGVVRHVAPFYLDGDRLRPHLSLVAAMRLLGAGDNDVEVVPRERIVVRPRGEGAPPFSIPLGRDGRMIINWPVPPGVDWPEAFTHVAYGSFLDLAALRDEAARDARALERVWGELDKSFGGKWAAAADPAARAKVEADMLEFLRKNTRVGPDEEKELSEVERQDLAQMRHFLGAVETQQGRIARGKDLTARLAAAVEGRLCLVGMTASGSTDLKPTPTHPLWPGVGVHSAVVNSILLWSFIREAPPWLNALVLAAMGLAVGAAAGWLSMRWSAIVSAALLVGWAAAAWALFAYAGVWVQMAGPVIAGVLAYAAVTAWRHFTEERQKRHIREAFQHYLAPAVVEEMLSHPERLKLGGERKELTVFFSDVAGFTPIAEALEPEDLVGLLNDYLSEMSEVILETKGYINKYEGDLIMAVFGAPLDDPEHAVTACRAALRCQRRLAEYRERLAREKRPILRARIGINSGVMLVGNMGSHSLFDYTVMGDNVNVGSRLEGANKAFGTDIMIGENTYALVKDRFETRRLGLVAVKGRVKPVGVWELIAEKGQCPPLVAQLLPHYERGLAAYSEQKWEEALEAFAECLKIHPDDGPSRAYLRRCEELRRSVRVERWDGTFTLEQK